MVSVIWVHSQWMSQHEHAMHIRNSTYYPQGFCNKYDQWCEHNADICKSYVPGFYNFVTPQCSSIGSNCTSGSQTTSKQNVKVSISDYPKFTGLVKDWISFERKFRLVASSQGFEYVHQEEEYEPITENERSSYKLDLSFIYDAFQNSWADSMNFYLVEQNKLPRMEERYI